MKYVIGVDIGTSGAKAIALSQTGKQLFVCNVSYTPIIQFDSARHELDPAILLQAFVELVNRTTDALPGEELAAICLSTAMHGLICLDEEGEPLTNLITWADQRSIDVATQMRLIGHGEKIHKLCGVPIHPMLPLCKIAWLKNNDSALFNQSKKFVGIKEYLLQKIFGACLIDESLAAATGLFNIHTREWEPFALELAGIDATRLPQTCDSLKTISGLTNYGKATLRIPFNTFMVVGSSDGCLANIGSGCFDNRSIALTIGTSGAVRRIISREQYHYNSKTFAYNLEEGFVIGGPINNGGILLKWYAENFLDRSIQNSSDFEWFVNDAMSCSPGADGLIFLPYIYGERAPVWDAKAKGAFIGVHNAHTRHHFMRSILEGISFSLRKIVNVLIEPAGDSTEKVHDSTQNLNQLRIYASGGFTRSSQWVQLLCDVLGVALYVREEGDASATGAAMMSMKSIGWISNYNNLNTAKTQQVYLPRLEVKRLYDRMYEVHEKLYDQLGDTFHDLYDIRTLAN